MHIPGYVLATSSLNLVVAAVGHELPKNKRCEAVERLLWIQIYKHRFMFVFGKVHTTWHFSLHTHTHTLKRAREFSVLFFCCDRKNLRERINALCRVECLLVTETEVGFKPGTSERDLARERAISSRVAKQAKEVFKLNTPNMHIILFIINVIITSIKSVKYSIFNWFQRTKLNTYCETFAALRLFIRQVPALFGCYDIYR